jgi:heme-degrading monooxygenase HmoA
MNFMQQVSTTRHEYRLKTWQRVFFMLLGLVFAGIGGFVAFIAAAHSGRAVEVIMPIFFIGMGLYLAAYALRSRVVIDGARIEVRDAFRDRAADLSEIEGFRTISSRNGRYTQLCLKEERGKITISQSFATDDDYRAWFQQLTDLDARDRDALLDEISHDTELGSTPEERLNALKLAKTVSIAIIAVSVAAAVGLDFGARNLYLPSAAVLALVPVAAMLLMQRSPLLYAVFKKKADPRADLSIALMIAGFGMFLSGRNLHLVSVQPLLLMAVPVALVYIASFFNSARKSSSSIATLYGLVVFAVLYSYPLVVLADTLLDTAKPASYTVPVTGKHMVRGRSTTYYLDLAPWGPLQNPNKISVSSSFYRDAQPGDQICLDLHPGRLHAPWYQRIDCSVAPVSDAQQ